MKWIKSNSAVYNTNSDIVFVDYTDINLLIENVEQCKDKRIRICAHQSPHDNVHEMLIVLQKNSYIRPHKHINKCESFHIIDGFMDVIIFDDLGNIHDIIPMGNFVSKNNFYYRLSAPLFHTILLKSDIVIFHETTNGPFIENETVYPDWAPTSDALDDIILFNNHLQHAISNFNKQTITSALELTL